MKLNNYLTDKCKTSEEALTHEFDKFDDCSSWSDLNKVILLQVLVFNRKRVGEVEKLLLTDFEKKHNIQKDSNVYKNLNPGEKILSAR